MNRRQFLTAGAAVTASALLVGRAGAGTLLDPTGAQGLDAATLRHRRRELQNSALQATSLSHAAPILGKQ